LGWVCGEGTAFVRKPRPYCDCAFGVMVWVPVEVIRFTGPGFWFSFTVLLLMIGSRRCAGVVVRGALGAAVVGGALGVVELLFVLLGWVVVALLVLPD
jgi:hypothetical protein